MHPIITVLDWKAPLHYGEEEGETGIRVAAMLHQDAYGVDALDKEGYPRGGEPLPVSDKRRYIEITLRKPQYFALPVCTWRLSGNKIVDIVIVEEGKEQEQNDESAERGQPQGQPSGR